MRRTLIYPLGTKEYEKLISYLCDSPIASVTEEILRERCEQASLNRVKNQILEEENDRKYYEREARIKAKILSERRMMYYQLLENSLSK